MKKAFNPALLSILLFSAVACHKNYQKCSSAQVSVKNIGTHTIHYGWNTNAYTDSIKPGASAVTTVGAINTDPNNSETESVDFESDHGNFRITVTQCGTTNKEIQ